MHLRSIFLYLKYNNFDYVLDGDLGAGEDSEENDCITDRDTSQRDFQTPTARVLVDLGMDENFGVDVLHIAHHGSESSTSADYFDLLSPEVATNITSPSVISSKFGPASESPSCSMFHWLQFCWPNRTRRTHDLLYVLGVADRTREPLHQRASSPALGHHGQIRKFDFQGRADSLSAFLSL